MKIKSSFKNKLGRKFKVSLIEQISITIFKLKYNLPDRVLEDIFKIDHVTINRIIKRHAEISGVHPIQAKGLRHSHASYLINEHNIDVLVISRRLGHSSPEITLKHYAHLWSRNDESVANAIEGDIAIKHSKESQVKFNGNQSIKKTEP